jgi:hypothetical protein
VHVVTSPEEEVQSVDKVVWGCNEEMPPQIRALLLKYQHCISETLLPSKHVDMPPIDFPPLLCPPIRRRQYPLKAEAEAAAWDITQQYVAQGRVEELLEGDPEVELTHFSPVIVPKVAGKQRMCIDPGPVNMESKRVLPPYLTLVDPTPMPTLLRHALQEAGDTGRFSQVDLTAGFHQMKLATGAKRLFGYRLRGRVYRFTCLVFGWVFSPPIFSGAVTEHLGPRWYVDDKQWGSRSVAELAGQLETLLQTCDVRNYVLKGSKMHLWQQKLLALGFELSLGGVRASACQLKELLDKGEVVANGKSLHTYLGLLEWLSLAFPVLNGAVREARRDLHQKCSKPKWTTDDQVEVQSKLKLIGAQMMSAHPIAAPRSDQKLWFHLMCDSSMHTIGAVLIQSPRADKPQYPDRLTDEVVVGVLSKSLPKHATPWAIHEKETWASVHSIGKFTDLLAGSPSSPIVLWTDNEAWFKAVSGRPVNNSQKWDRWGRWLSFLARFPNIMVQYTSGVSNQIADLLSRMECWLALLPAKGCECEACTLPHELDDHRRIPGWLGGGG